MKGTAILFQENQKVTMIEEIEHCVYEELKAQSGDEHCKCKLNNKIVDFGPVSPVFWHENEVDWDYGY
jgi:predicted ThiF/HesA family dinucleotide-utilizing enzyme